MATDIFTGYRLTGILLILAFILFAIGASLPLLGEKGNIGIYNLPEREYLLSVAGNAVVWRWANIILGVAAVALVAGLILLTTILAGKERAFSQLGLVGFLLAAMCWLIFSAFRATVTISAAQAMTAAGASGAVPGYYAPLAQWAGAIYMIYTIIGFLALAAYGISLLQAGLLPAWVGWATLIYSAALLLLLVIQGDTLPAFHYLPGLLIGGFLLLHR